ncbi:hypothetical protein F4860DRAFT_479113 [Xylaria cubensis]|nr:hypothetical protein F4860DRAFT_479113 [Xylaria cubensis]
MNPFTSPTMTEKKNSSTSFRDVAVAICGMAMKLPGEIDSEQAFWDFLINKKDARHRISEDRYNVDGFQTNANRHDAVWLEENSGGLDESRNGSLSDDGHPGITYGYMLKYTDLTQFDASSFSVTRTEVEWMDPQQRILLEMTRECFENAGEVNWRGKDIGCYIGSWGEDWMEIHARDTLDSHLYKITGQADLMLSNRISYEYDLKGPSLTLKTGCSAAMIALDLAVKAIQEGQIESSIVGGSNLILSPSSTYAMIQQGVLSPNASCKTFDAEADGYVRAEAINMLYVKRLDSAIRDGNPVRAIIRATASNSDGKTAGIAHPSSESQEALIRGCYASAGITNFAETGFFECHGTGTRTGDPIETAAVANIFGGEGIYIGSVKPNLGHSEGASGLTSVIKGVLALEHKVIPPNIKFNKPNAEVPFQRGKLQVPVESTKWPKGRRERVSINSFGIGGANAHVILDSADEFGLGYNKKATYLNQKPQLLVFTGNNARSVKQGTSNSAAFVHSHPELVSDVAYTLARHREHQPYRSFAVTDGTSPPDFSAEFKAPSTSPSVIFVFTGQGSQWAGMGRRLLADFPSVSVDLTSMDEALSELGESHRPTWSLKESMETMPQQGQHDQAQYSQTMCTAIQIVMINLLRQWRIVPQAVVGHSSGEIAAAYACEALTMRQAIISAYMRGLLVETQARPGAMAAVGLGRDDIQRYLIDGVVLACENSDVNSTLSGDEATVDLVLRKINEDLPDIFCKRLKVNKAYHSDAMKDVGAAYEESLQSYVTSKTPMVPFFSAITGEVIDRSEMLGPAYWRSNLESPVLFLAATRNLLGVFPCSLLVEIGPHSALSAPIRQILRLALPDNSYVPTLVRSGNCSQNLLRTAGALFSRGVEIDFSAICPTGRVLTTLPKYPWHHDEQYWHESRLSREWKLRKFPHHDILGSPLVENNNLRPAWRNVLLLDNVVWLRDHMIGKDAVFPAAGYVAMACEAIRQVSGAEQCLMRDININVAMILHESVATETMFSMWPYRLTTTLDSAWYEFVILSYNGTIWVKHCTGQVRRGTGNSPNASRITHLPRKVQTSSWYQAMSQDGLRYGPRFQTLHDVSAHPSRNVAFAKMSENLCGQKDESHYFLHPTTLDACLQLFPAAAARGLARNWRHILMPTYIANLWIRRPVNQLSLQVEATINVQGFLEGEAYGMDVAGSVLQLKGVRMSPLYEGGDPNLKYQTTGVRLQWKPDIDFVQIRDLITSTKNHRSHYVPLQHLLLLCCIEAHRRMAERVTKSMPSHLRKFYAWLDAQVNSAIDNDYLLVSNSNDIVSLSVAQRLELIQKYSVQISDTEIAVIGTALCRIYDNIEGIADGQVDVLECLLHENVLMNIYNLSHEWHYKPLIQLLGHSRPHLRILEVGAGTGATSELMLNSLISEFGTRTFYSYTFTDISTGFFPAAKERFKNVSGMQFLQLDITQDPEKQGFMPHSFDLIIATDVLHVTPKLQDSLRNIHRLLCSDGKLLIQELCTSSKWVNFVMGTLPAWWVGEDDARIHEPYVTTERWIKELNESGFSGADAVVFDDDEPFQTAMTIVASPSGKKRHVTNVSLLSSQPHGSLAMSISNALEQAGLTVTHVGLRDKPKEGVISLLDLEGLSFLENISKESYDELKAFLLETNQEGLLWLTRPCQIRCLEPSYALFIGLARSLRNELGINIATLELDNINTMESINAIVGVYMKLQQARTDGDVDVDSEFAWSRGTVHIPRFHWVSVNDNLATASDARIPKQLEVDKIGSLKNLRWIDKHTPIGLKGNEVEVDVRAVGVNFKDVLIAMGVVDGCDETGINLGCECSGIIRSTGPEAAHLQPGDRVIVPERNTYSTTLRTKESLCAKIPDDLSFEDAATIPCVYGTVVHGLLDLAKLQQGQSVLIHSACGGIGIAAIYISRMVGAEIYATVGNEDKVQFLMKQFGIARERIFYSRDSTFLPDLLRETDGKGADVVLNSLSGELLHVSWNCVAEFGSMVELGKRDFIGQGRLAMNIFENNRAFFGVDMAQICKQRPEMVRNILERCMEFYEAGFIQVIRPTQIFEASDIVGAFRLMQKGQHIGKIVVRMPLDLTLLNAGSSRPDLTFRTDSSYLLVGGLGGLGRSVSTWMVERGATNLIYLSRSGGAKPEDNDLVRELQGAGCTAQIFAGSVTNIDDIHRVIKEARFPIAGVINATMVLKSGMFADMTHSDWEDVIAPKVLGTWNLHNALSSSCLDFFILFSSMSGMVGPRGQANYAAANTFLDAFVQYREGLGLPASVLDIGAVGDVGYISENQKIMDQYRFASVEMLSEHDLLNSLELAIRRPKVQMSISEHNATTGYLSENQIGLGLGATHPLASPQTYITWKRDPRMGEYRIHEEGGIDTMGEEKDDKLKTFLSTIQSSPRVLLEDDSIDLLAAAVGSTLYTLLMRPVEDLDISTPITLLGIDSLVAIELHNWTRQKLGLRISVLEIMGSGTIRDLAKLIAEDLMIKFGVGAREGITFSVFT